MKRALLLALIAVAGAGCSKRKSEPPPALPPVVPGSAQAPTPDTIRESEVAAVQRETEAGETGRACKHRVTVFEGSIDVDAKTYVHPVAHGDTYTDEPIADLDRVVSRAKQIEFTLDYPFEKPFTSAVTAPITLRRIIDAVRSGFHHMYEGTTQRDIQPQLENKDVRGAYGQAFHVIGDLVIESIDLCDDQWLDINIGS